MARPSRKLHELTPKNRGGKAYVWYGNRWVYLGRWDNRRGEPTPEAAQRFDELRALWRVDPLSGSSPDSQALLIDVWADWLQSPQRPQGSPYIVRTQRYLFGTATEPGPHFATRADQFDGRALLAWQSHLCNVRETRDPTRTLFSRSTVDQCIRLIRACLDWGLIHEMVTYEQVYQLSKVKSPKSGEVRENGKRLPVARALVDPVLPHLVPALRAVVELIWLTCSRPSEILGLRVGDIQRTGSLTTPGGVVLDLEKLGVWCAVLTEHKTDSAGFERVIFFGPKSQVVLAPFLNRTGYLFAPGETQKATHKSVVHKARYRSTALNAAVQSARRRAGVGPWVPYSLRHSGLRIVQAKFGRDGARAIAGHRVGGATENYVGSDLHTAARIAADLG